MLQINPDKVCYVVVKAREFDAKTDVVEPKPGSNPSDDQMREVLEDYRDDPVGEELTAFIDALDVDEQVDLVALAWLGRGTFDDFESARCEARRMGGRRTAAYLLGIPELPDFLEEGLSRLGHSCADFERGHL
jgi:hypothetical protein